MVRRAGDGPNYSDDIVTKLATPDAPPPTNRPLAIHPEAAPSVPDPVAPLERPVAAGPLKTG